jgi:two-component system KDP operon response regulator KdpE
MAYILLVDDEKTIHTFLKHVLGKRGHKVDGALSGDLALEMVEGNDYDLYLIDLDMPQMSGEDLVIRLRKIGKGDPFLILSGLPEDEVKSACDRLHGIGYIRKPFRIEKLLTAIDAAQASPPAP